MFEKYVAEIIMGLFLLVLAGAFRNWASTVKASSTAILEQLATLYREFHEHTLKTENRVSTVEEQAKNNEKAIDQVRFIQATRNNADKQD